MPQQPIGRIVSSTDAHGIINSTSAESLFWYPEFLRPSSALPFIWMLFWLVAVLQPRRVATLGTGDGVAHFALAQALSRAQNAESCHGFGAWAEGVPWDLSSHQSRSYPALSHLEPLADLPDLTGKLAQISPSLVFVNESGLPDHVSVADAIAFVPRSATIVLIGLRQDMQELLTARRRSITLTSGSGAYLRIFLSGREPLPLQVLHDACVNGAVSDDMALLFLRDVDVPPPPPPPVPSPEKRRISQLTMQLEAAKTQLRDVQEVLERNLTQACQIQETLERELNDARHALARLEQDLNIVRKAKAVRERDLAALRMHINALYASSSWRLTAPLRWLQLTISRRG